MLDKLKSVGESAKNIVLYIVIPVASLFGYIIYLLSSMSKLKSDIEVSKAEKDLANTLNKVEDAKHEADMSEGNYDKLRADYIKQYGPVTTESDTKPGA